jgi:NADH-quinone oxidoreductase subunit M
MGKFVTFPELLLWLPLIGGILAFFIKDQKKVKNFSLLISFLVLAVSITSLFYTDNTRYLSYNNVSYQWLKYLGSSFFVGLDGMGFLLTFLTAVSFPLILASTYKHDYKSPNAFYGLMLLSQAGLMGVFVAMDALVFYFFWELALIPVYFLSSMWGGERRIQATFKFFIYTFVASLIMLVGIIYLYQQTGPTNFSDHSFTLRAFQAVSLSAGEQSWLFWLFFIAFAVKMPVFPLHTWQPDAYEQSPYPTTMVLSGIMVKMGVFAVLRWVLPIFPDAIDRYDNIIIGFAVVGMIYASLIAIVQDDLKRFIAYSSIAHIGLIAAAVFAGNQLSIEGAIVQMFNHGINIIGLWIIVDIIENKTGVRKMSQLGGLAHTAPALAILLVIIALANIGLPLTNGFIGEFTMFAGLFQFNAWYAAFAGISIILAAVYMLNMIQKVFFGERLETEVQPTDINLRDKLVLYTIVGMILFLGVFPKPIFRLVDDTVTNILTKLG